MLVCLVRHEEAWKLLLPWNGGEVVLKAMQRELKQELQITPLVQKKKKHTHVPDGSFSVPRFWVGS